MRRGIGIAVVCLCMGWSLLPKGQPEWQRALAKQPAPKPMKKRPQPHKPKSPLKKWVAMLRNKRYIQRKKGIDGLRRMGARAARAVPLLITSLQDPYWQIREGAASLLSQTGAQGQHKKVIGALVQLAVDKHWQVRAASLHAMQRLNKGQDLLRKSAHRACKDPVAQVRERAVELMGQLSPLRADTRELLHQAYKDTSWPVRAAAIASLTQTGAQDTATLSVLSQALRDKEPAVQQMGVQALLKVKSTKALTIALKASLSTHKVTQRHGVSVLGQLRPVTAKARQRLVLLLQAPSASTREQAALSLAQMGAGALPALPALIRCFRDQHTPVRVAAIDASSRMGQKAVPALVRALRQKDPLTKRAAARTLSALGPSAAGATLFLIDALLDTNWKVRREASWALYRIGPAIRGRVPGSLLPVLINALRDRLWKVRYSLIKTIGHIGPQAKVVIGWFGSRAVSTLGVLKRLTKDKDPRVRRAAHETLRKLQRP